MRYFLMVLGIGAAAGALAVSAVAVAFWPEPQVEYRVEVVERVTYASWDDVAAIETPAIDSMMDDGWLEESERQSDCLFDWLQAEVGYEITLERVLGASMWLDSLGGPCEVMGR